MDKWTIVEPKKKKPTGRPNHKWFKVPKETKAFMEKNYDSPIERPDDIPIPVIIECNDSDDD